MLTVLAFAGIDAPDSEYVTLQPFSMTAMAAPATAIMVLSLIFIDSEVFNFSVQCAFRDEKVSGSLFATTVVFA